MEQQKIESGVDGSKKVITIQKITEHVILFTLARPKALNAFNTEMALQIYNFFEELALNPASARVIIITGYGDKAFCAGADLKERVRISTETWHKQHIFFERMIRSIIDCPIPVIGAVNGLAYGGGCEVVGACDFVFASEDAKFAQPETKLGIIPGAGGTQNLPRTMGERRAKELIFTGSPFSADEAYRWGLVNQVVPKKELLQKVQKVAEKISKNSPLAIRQAKQAIHRGLQLSLRDGLAFEIEAYNRTINTNDRREGLSAFNEKRKPNYTGT